MNTPPDEGAPQAPPATILPEAVGSPRQGVSAPSSGTRAAFSGLGRQLTNEELDSPGARKMLLDNFDRVEAECVTLREYQNKYHEADKRAAVLDARLRGVKAMDVLYTVCVCVGGVIIGYGPAIAAVVKPEVASQYNSTCTWVGGALIMVACAARIFFR
jgi:hypothetical protein